MPMAIRSLCGALLCLTMCCVVQADDAPQPKGLKRSLVVSGQGYFPVALRLKDDRIAVVLRGGAGHLGINGRLDIVFSADEGQTWSKPVVVNDSFVDDRNPAFGQAANGGLGSFGLHGHAVEGQGSVSVASVGEFFAKPGRQDQTLVFCFRRKFNFGGYQIGKSTFTADS